jgi:RHS repeat-associated protein
LALSNTTGSATLLSSQLFAPYGVARYGAGTSMSSYTSKGFSGQYGDAVTGLDYYVSRSYDPVSGLFLSADKAEGNAQGLNPYAYVGGNPETLADPTGQMYAPPGGGSGGEGGSQQQQQQQQEQYTFQYIEHGGIARSGLPVLLDLYLNHYSQWALAESYDENVMHGSTQLLLGMLAFGLLHDQTINWNASQNLRRLFVQLQGMALPGLQGMAMADAHNPEFAAELQSAMVQSAEALSKDVAIDNNGDISSLDEGGPCSFTPQTKVETKHGEQAIGTLALGEQVFAYNPKTRKMEYEPILHVWIHQDNDLVDLTITFVTYTSHSRAVTKTSETIHTNKKHPFFTEEQGFVPVGQLKLGMHVLRADGQYGLITGWKIVPGVKTMFNLEVAQDHTFTVGIGEWVVHNSGSCNIDSSQPYNRSALGRTPSPKSTQEVLVRDPNCVYCGEPSTVADHEPSLQQRWISGEYDNMSYEQILADADDPNRMVGACVSCNSSKSGSPLEGEGDGWNYESSPSNLSQIEWL